MIEILYFAWLRERVGLRREQVETGATDVRALIEELKSRSEGHALAFADLGPLRVALDQSEAGLDSPLAGVREVAFFPPMIGG